MERTNIYLDDGQLRALRHLAAEEDVSVADLVRRAVDLYVLPRLSDRDWQIQFDGLVAKIRSRAGAVPSSEIEADITVGREEVRRRRHRA